MKRRHGATLLGGLLLLFVLSTAPARLLALLVPAQQLQLGFLQGTVWRGTASSAVLRVPGGGLQLGQLQWRLSPASLLLLSPRFQLHGVWGEQRLTADLTLYPNGSLRLRNSSAAFTASLLKQWLPLQLGGSMRLQLRELRLRGGLPTAGSGQLSWQRAVWYGTSSNQLLGDYTAEFRLTAGPRASATVQTQAGPVHIEGTLALRARRYAVDARLTSAAGFGAELASALQLMAVPIADGYHVKFNSAF